MSFWNNDAAMELRHLRYFVAVADALNFTRAAVRLRVTQSASSRQVVDLEDEIGVDLLQRSPRGVTLTAEGKFFLEEARKILAQTDETVAKARALARGEFGELHIGYAPSPTTELLPSALAAFQRAIPHVSVRLHDLAGNELGDGLRAGQLHFAVMHRPFAANAVGLEFELLRGYPICVASAPAHALNKMKLVPLARLAQEKLIGFRRQEYGDYHRLLERVFAPASPPRLAIECDSASSLVTEIESGRGVAIVPQIFSRIFGKRVKLRPLTPEPALLEVGIVRVVKGDITPAGERFCQELRAIAGK
jgi:DNA-binding transcriptional LysR family regulator